jgi:colicin import membrane protein
MIAIALHIIVFAMFFVGFQSSHHAASDNMAAPIDIVQAQVIDGAAIDAEKRRIQAEQQALLQKQRDEALRLKKQQEEKARLAREQKEKEEQQRLAKLKQAEEQKKQAEIAKQKAELAKKQAEQERLQAEQAKAEAREAQLKAEQERKKAEEEKARLAEELEKQAEIKRQAQKQAELEAEQKRQAAILEQEEAELRAAEQQAQQAARQRQQDKLQSQYVSAISGKVTSRWRKPPSLKADNFECKVYVRQVPGGFIKEVRVDQCSGGDETLRRSVEEAVWKSDPLPTPPDDELFLREFILTFKPPQ